MKFNSNKSHFLYLVLLLFIASCNQKKDRILPTKTQITESVYSSVTIQPDSLYQVYAVVGGLLDKNLVEEGDTVQKDEPVMQIVNTTPKLNMENAKLALQLARENYMGKAAVLSGIKDEIKAAKLQLKNDSINYGRQKNLWEQRIGSKIEYDNRKLAFELSKNNLSLLQSRYDRTKNELETQLKQAENNYRTSMISTEDFTVASKINGTVYALFKNPGEIVSTMEPLASIGRSDAFVIEMLVDEVDIVKIQIGQKALITLDAYDSKVFEATVHKIYPRKDERSQTFKIEAIFNDAPKILYPGLAGEGNIIVAQKKGVLTIPKEYLISETKVRTENGIKAISVGLQSMDEVEITSGIDADTYILRPEE
ncbi:MAG: efflux RND transporter periplasmic adaptor subunit [Saonia sp.]